jgi:UDP-N-acetyl-D-mannosaminuronic acid transferase (WecB/TagA/CpsF family)
MLVRINSDCVHIAGEQEMDQLVRFQKILGIRFLVGNAQEAIDQVSRSGGLVVVPAAPALKNLPHDEKYRTALLGADFAIADSALMVVLWNLLERDRIPKLSGLKYLRKLIAQADFRKPGASFWVMPTEQAARRNVDWLNQHGVAVSGEDVYLAPIYGAEIDDQELLRRLNEQRPHHVVLGIGGGTQERLGLYLKQNLSYTPAIHCIGAAIAFLSGDQCRIPVWADTLGLGWMLRSLSNPRRFAPRYWDARHLILMLFRYRERLPVDGA